MSELDWRSPEPYQRMMEAGDRANFAWESLRRSPNFRIASLEASKRSGNVSDEFRRRWGVCFRA
ncbi:MULTISPECIES: transcriptional regulator domain-containing protein [Bradyrhizobium]|uniref:transcriptional regulator domain-containing protein n=1 Tax=Bradyrhizobium TaxID=374 RepID=UPI0009BF3176|nr:MULTISPECIES: DUF6499 domain-containing protein [unclassified Bradyrhizobium]